MVLMVFKICAHYGYVQLGSNGDLHEFVLLHPFLVSLIGLSLGLHVHCLDQSSFPQHNVNHIWIPCD